MCRVLTVLGRFVACYADSATENAKLLLANDVRVTFVENPHPGPFSLASRISVPYLLLQGEAGRLYLLLQGEAGRLSPSPRRPASPRTTCGPPSPPARPCTGRARDRRPAARPRVFGRNIDVRSRASAPPLRLCIRFKLANSLPEVRGVSARNTLIGGPAGAR